MTRHDWFWRVLGIVLILGVWELYGRSASPLLMPPVSRVVRELWIALSGGVLIKAFGQSMGLLFSGLVLGTVSGIVLGLAMGRYPKFADIVNPYFLAIYASPRVAMMPLIIVWFGLGYPAKVVVVFLTCFFEVMVATIDGVRQTSKAFVEVARSFTLPDHLLFTKVILPGSMSYILSGIRLGVGHGLVGMVVAELFLESSGIGGLVNHSAQQFRTDRVLASIATVAFVGIALSSLLRYAEHRFAPWHQETFE